MAFGPNADGKHDKPSSDLDSTGIGESGPGGVVAEVTSSMGTSTAVAMTESATDQIYDKVFDKFKSNMSMSSICMVSDHF